MIYNLLIIFFLNFAIVTATLTEGPVSVSVLGGENALFHCAGNGAAIVWIVDGLYSTELPIMQRGISSQPSGTIQSTLTVPATLVNNGTTVQCVIYPSEVTSNNATLTVLPGIGQVVNVRFTPSFSAVQWDPPATAGVLSGLSYVVIVMNNNTDQVIVSDTTNNTVYPLPQLPFCQYYTANVTAFSSQHRSESVVIGQRQGEIYILSSSQGIDVTRKDSSSIKLSVYLNLEVLDGLPCPGQMLNFQTYPRDDVSNITDHSEVLVSGRGDHVYPITVAKGKLLCTAAISLIANDAVIKVLNLNFSTFDVQNCNITTSPDQSSIIVECRFAINSTALSGIAVIKDEHDEEMRDVQLNIKHGNNMKSVNITDLPTGKYKVSVYDSIEDDQPAYQHPEFLKIVAHSPTPTPSTTVVHTDIPFTEDASVYTSNVAVTSTPPPPVVKTDSTPVIIGSSVAAVVAAVIVMIILGFLLGVCIFKSKYCKKASPVTAAPDATIDTVINIEKDNEYAVVNKQPEHVVNINTTPPTIVACKKKHLVQQSINSPPSECTVTDSEITAKQKELVYADLHHSTNPPAPPLPVEPVPVQYATVKAQTAIKDKVTGKLHVYADLHHSTNPPAPPLPAESFQKGDNDHVPVDDNLTLNKNTAYTMSGNTSLYMKK